MYEGYKMAIGHFCDLVDRKDSQSPFLPLYYRRRVAKDEKSAEELAKCMLTNLYNQMPAWLRQAHQKLDEAVFAAY